MRYQDLRDFITQLEARGELKRVKVEVDPYLEITEICDRTLRAGGPALLFERVKGSPIPVLANLFGTPRRVALGMGEEDVGALREVGRHGIILVKDGRRAVFLPDVAVEQGWDREQTLTRLAQKAGLPSDGWREGAQYFVFTNHKYRGPLTGLGVR